MPDRCADVRTFGPPISVGAAALLVSLALLTPTVGATPPPTIKICVMVTKPAIKVVLASVWASIYGNISTLPTVSNATNASYKGWLGICIQPAALALYVRHGIPLGFLGTSLTLGPHGNDTAYFGVDWSTRYVGYEKYWAVDMWSGAVSGPYLI